MTDNFPNKIHAHEPDGLRLAKSLAANRRARRVFHGPETDERAVGASNVVFANGWWRE
jgi:hypothetical protein